MKSPYIWFVAGVAGTAIVFLLADGSVGTVLPLLIVLACPLMMIFMMRSMGSMHGQRPAGQSRGDAATPDAHHTPSSGDQSRP